MKITYVVVCGGRDFTDKELLRSTLDEICKQYLSPVIVSGMCRGADLLAKEYAEENNLPFKGYPADWGKYGKRAGYLRNKEMAAIGDVLIAFDGGRGTKMMIELAYRDGEFSKIQEVDSKIQFVKTCLSDEAKDARAASAEMTDVIEPTQDILGR